MTEETYFKLQQLNSDWFQRHKHLSTQKMLDDRLIDNLDIDWVEEMRAKENIKEIRMDFPIGTGHGQFTFRQVSSTSEFKAEILKEYPICSWIGCNEYSTDPHHIVRRSYKLLKFILENGIGFCRKHHKMIEKLPKKEYWQAIRYLIPKWIYRVLFELNPF